jgi:SagB-type dehydrogenase family enzyme
VTLSLFEWNLSLADEAYIRVQTRLRADSSVHTHDEGQLELDHPWGRLSLSSAPPVAVELLRKMATGWLDGAQLRLAMDEVAGDGTLTHAKGLGEVLWLLNQLEFACITRIVDDGEPLLTVQSLSPLSRLTFRGDTVSAVILASNVFISAHPDGFALETATGGHRVIIHDADVWELLGGLAQLRVAGIVSSAQAETNGFRGAELVFSILDATCMVETRAIPEPAGDPRDVFRASEQHDLLFHRRSRFGFHDRGFGATFRHLGKFPPAPAIPGPEARVTIPLDMPLYGEIEARDPTLLTAMEKRKSVRTFGDEPLTLDQLSELLFRCARARARYGPDPQNGMPYEATDRPYPSGGGIYDLEFYVVANQVADLPRDAYHYAADRHALEMLEMTHNDTSALVEWTFRAAGVARPPQALVVLTSRFYRMSWKYESIAYATTLKNVGVVYQCVYLVATAMGLGCCALGSGNDIVANRALKLQPKGELPVGELMIGTLAKSSDELFSKAERQPRKHLQPLMGMEWGRG